MALSAVMIGCTPGPAGLPEPEWGNAPPPRAEEVVEIIVAHERCSEVKCTIEVIRLNQAGGADRAFYTGERYDSILLSGIDSLTFIEAAQQLEEAHFFDPSGSGTTVHPVADVEKSWTINTFRQQASEPVLRPPGNSESWVISATTCCRRRSVKYGEAGDPVRRTPPRPVVGLQEIVRRLRWMVPVGVL